jgi:DNA-directed RNA polymerase subunit RPC12/RpoP
MAKVTITLEQIVAAIESGEYRGFCLACGIEVDGVEPDARRYACDACGARRVYGAEEVLIMRGV